MLIQVLLYIILIFFANNSETKEVHKIVRIDRLEECGNYGHDIQKFINVKIENPPRRNFIVNVESVLLRDCKENPKMMVHVTRCASKEALDTCVPFTTLRPLDTCTLLGMKHTAWSDIIDNIHPPVECRMKAGKYKLINGTVNLDLFNIFPIDKYYWKTQFDFMEGNDKVSFCVDLHTSLFIA